VSAVLAFLFNPDILILDEPTAGLDPLAAEILKEKMIQKRNEGKLILITSHLLSELEDVVSQVIFMQDGSIQLHESKTDIIHRSGKKSLAKAIAKILFTENQMKSVKSGEGQA
jgi:Cu-processing system ATP-binding protein